MWPILPNMEEISFVQEHYLAGRTALFHSSVKQVVWMTKAIHLGKVKFAVVSNPNVGNLIIDNCNYLGCEFNLLRGHRYNQIFLKDSGVPYYNYPALLKMEKGDFIYSFDLGEYVFEI